MRAGAGTRRGGAEKRYPRTGGFEKQRHTTRHAPREEGNSRHEARGWRLRRQAAHPGTAPWRRFRSAPNPNHRPAENIGRLRRRGLQAMGIGNGAVSNAFRLPRSVTAGSNDAQCIRTCKPSTWQALSQPFATPLSPSGGVPTPPYSPKRPYAPIRGRAGQTFSPATLRSGGDYIYLYLLLLY